MNVIRAAVTVLVVFCWCRLASAEFRTPIHIREARIVFSDGRTLERGEILVKDGRIAAVGPRVEAAPDAEPFDATGLVVYPGFIDACSYAGMTQSEPSDDERARVEDENPDVRQGPQSATVQAYRRLMHPHWRAAELFDEKAKMPTPAMPRAGRGGGGAGNDEPPVAPSTTVREEYRSAGFTVALVTPKQAIFSGISAVIALGDAPLRRSLLIEEFAQHAGFVTGVGLRDFAALFDRPRYPTTTMGAMAAFRQMLLDADWQDRLVAWSRRHPLDERPPVDRDLEVLQRLRKAAAGQPQLPVAFLAESEQEIHRALDMAEEFRLRPILVGGREAWKVADRLREQRVPVLLSLKWTDEPKPRKEEPARKSDPASRPASELAAPASTSSDTSNDSPATTAPTTEPATRKRLFDDDWESQPWEPARVFDERRRLWGEEVDNARRLHEAGVLFAFGTYEQKSPADVLKNLRTAMERGLSPDIAVKALTHQAAEILGLTEHLGEIEPGRLANLTLLSKPIAEKDAKVRYVFVDGKRHEVEDADSAGPGAGRGRGRGRGGRGGREMDAPKADEKEAEEKPSTSAPADSPNFASEIEADRKPRLHTGGHVLLKNATVLKVNGEEPAKADVLIRDGRIVEIGASLSAPSDTGVLDLTGFFLSPGLIDPHSHMCSDGGLNEFALSVTCEVRVRDVINPRDTAAWRALAGGVTCIHTMHGSANTIGGQNATLRLMWGRPAGEWLFQEAPRTVKFALGENVKQSNTDRRSRGTRFPNSRAGVEAVFRRSFDAAVRYKKQWADYERDHAAGKDPRPIRRDLRLETLAAIYDGLIWVHCHCYRADEILRLLAMAEGYGFRVAVLQHVLEGYRLIPEMRRHGCGASTFSDWWAYKIEAYDAVPHNAARLAQGGVVATVNSDSAEVVRHLNLEAAKSMRFGGLSPEEALRLCTLNGAIQLGVDAHVGSVEVGKLADLAVFDAHPLDTFSKCVMTLIDGEVYFQHAAFDPPNKLPPARPLKAFAPPRPPMSMPQADEYWLVGADVYPVSGGTIAGGAVHVAAGKIAYVGPRPAKVNESSGVAVVDVTGLRLYPGLVNVGTTLGLEEIGSVPGTIDNAEIADFQPDLQAVWAYNPHSALVEVARCEGITSALVMQAGGMISAQCGLLRLSGWSMPEALRRSPVCLRMELPSLPVEFPREMPEERKAEAKRNHRRRLTELETFFRQAVHYARVARASADHPELAPEPDRRLEAMIPYVTGRRPVFFSANSYKQIREALEFARRYELKPVLLGGREAWKLADTLAAEKIDVIVSRPTSYPGGEFEPWASVYENAAVLARAGVRVAIAVNDPSLAKQIGVEAGLAVAHGLDEEAALRAITLDAARIVGVDDLIGSLEVGKVADLIVSTDSPLQASSCVVAEFIDGRPVDLTSRHTRSDDKFLHRPAPNLPSPPELRGPSAMRRAPLASTP